VADRRADVIWTDPPYGKGLKMPKWRRIANDDLRGEALRGFLGDTLGWATAFADRGAAAWVCCNWETVDVFIAALRDDLGLSYDGLVEWNKLSMGPGQGDLRPQHEFVLYHAGEQWHGGRDTVDVKELQRDDAREYDHPTQKPVEFIEDQVSLSSAAGQTVLDPFLGSGSTVIAAERTGRRCLGIECDWAYVQVAIERWERFTGRKAEKLGTEDLPEEVPPEATWWEAVGHAESPAERRWSRGQYPRRLADSERHVRHRGENPLVESSRRLARFRRLARGSGGSATGEENPG
jgi:DNA modification methylase